MKIGIRYQYIIYTFLVTAIIGGMITAYAVSTQRDNITKEFMVKGNSLSDLLAASLVSPLYELRIDQVSVQLAHTLADIDVQQAWVIDLEGYILSDGTDENTYRDEKIIDVYPGIPVLKYDQESVQSAPEHFLLDMGKSVLVVNPVKTASGERLGSVLLMVSLQRVEEASYRSIQDMLLISLGLLFLGLVMAHFVALKQLKPIKQIKAATMRIAEGDLKTRIESSRKDEIGELADAIDMMVQRLEISTVSKGYVDRIIRAMKDGLLVIDVNDKVKEVNPYLSSLLGSTREALIGQSFHRLFEKVQPLDALASISDIDYQACVNGENIFVQIVRSDLEGKQGVREVLAIVHDVTKERELTDLLLSAKTNAEESSKAKSTFLSMMSHELRTPLNAVIGLSSILLQREAGLSDRGKSSMQIINDSGQRLLEIIADVQLVAAIVSNDVPLTIQRCSLDEIMASVFHKYHPRAEEKGLLIEMDNPGQPVDIQADLDLVEKAISNLVINAINFTSSGSIKLSYGPVCRSGKSDWVEISVQDTGIGVAESRIPFLFDSFTQADQKNTRQVDGIGVGLMVTDKIIKQHGGQVLVRSKEGAGSTFSIQLPVHQG